MEINIQNKIRLALGKYPTVKMFRNNVGTGWVGKVQRNADGSILIHDPRPLHAGLIEGSSDLIGWTVKTVTPDMVGRKVAVFTAIEVKQPGKQPSPAQRVFIGNVRTDGGYAGVASDEGSALKITQGV
jgi:hypothetical protein